LKKWELMSSLDREFGAKLKDLMIW